MILDKKINTKTWIHADYGVQRVGISCRKDFLLLNIKILTAKIATSKMPESPAPISADLPNISSSGHLVSSSSQMIDGRPQISVVTGFPNGYHQTSPNQTLSQGLLNGVQQLPPTCGARQLSKLKRFLTTLQQFGSDISPEIGDRVRGFIVDLVNNTISVEEFHQQLQDATNFPLRPFVIPFLKANLPLLQQELLQCSRTSKPSPHRYLTPSESLPEHERERIKNEFEEFGFERPGDKRKNDDRPSENPHSVDSIGSSPSKRKYTAQPFEGEHGAILDQLTDNIKTDTDEWRNLDNILQSIVSYVDKAKCSISVLQERCVRDREEMVSWARAMATDAESEIKRRAAELMAKTLKQTDDQVNEAKRRAEDAVSDVKRQAIVELQKAVCAAEEKANDALTQAHQSMQKAVLEARRQATEEATSLINQQENSKENCWNCGRKASETCSGCNVAKYCGSFCQHKDWENHHKDCGKHAKHQEGTKSNSPILETSEQAPSSTPDHNNSPVTTVPSGGQENVSETESTINTVQSSSTS